MGSENEDPLGHANAIDDEDRMQRRRAHLRSVLKGRTRAIKPFRHHVLRHERSDGSILEPLLDWITRELQALHGLFNMHAELDRLWRLPQPEKTSTSRTLTIQESRRMLLEFETERQKKCEVVLEAARAHLEREDRETEALRQDLQEAREQKQHVEDVELAAAKAETGRLRRNLGRTQRRLKDFEAAHERVLAGKAEDVVRLGIASARAFDLEKQLRDIKADNDVASKKVAELEKNVKRDRAEHARLCDQLNQDRMWWSQEVERVREEQDRVTDELDAEHQKVAELETAREEMEGIRTEVERREEASQREKADLQRKLEEECSRSQRLSAMFEPITAQKAQVANKLALKERQVDALEAELKGAQEQFRIMQKDVGLELQAEKQRAIHLATQLETSTTELAELRSELGKERNRYNLVRKSLDGTSAEYVRVIQQRDDSTTRVAELQDRLENAGVEHSHLLATAEEREGRCNALTASLKAQEAAHVQSVLEMQAEINYWEEAHSEMEGERDEAVTKCKVATADAEATNVAQGLVEGQLDGAMKKISALEARLDREMAEYEMRKRQASEDTETRLYESTLTAQREAEARCSDFCRKLKTAEATSNYFPEALSWQRERIGLLESQLTQHRDAYVSITRACEEASRQRGESIASLAAATETIRSLQSDLVAKQSTMGRIQQACEETKTHLYQSNKLLSNSQQQTLRLRCQCEELERQLHRVRDELPHKRPRIASPEAQVEVQSPLSCVPSLAGYEVRAAATPSEGSALLPATNRDVEHDGSLASAETPRYAYEALLPEHLPRG